MDFNIGAVSIFKISIPRKLSIFDRKLQVFHAMWIQPKRTMFDWIFRSFMKNVLFQNDLQSNFEMEYQKHRFSSLNRPQIKLWKLNILFVILLILTIQKPSLGCVVGYISLSLPVYCGRDLLPTRLNGAKIDSDSDSGWFKSSIRLYF